MLYNRTADAYVLLEEHQGKDFAAEAKHLIDLIDRRAPGAASVLDVGCGSGDHLRHLGPRFERLAGIELSVGMGERAQRTNPTARIVIDDMRDARLEEAFDVVLCLNGSIAYMASTDDLTAALTSMAAHLAPDGVVMVEGWYGPEQWHSGRISAEAASAGGLGVGRLVATTSDGDAIGVLHMAYLITSASGVEHTAEEHRTGLFTDDQYEAAFAAAGLDHSIEPGIPGTGFRLRVGQHRASS